MDIPTLAFYLIIGNLLHGGFLTAVSIRYLVRAQEAYDQKFNGLTYLIKGVALILISLFLSITSLKTESVRDTSSVR